MKHEEAWSPPDTDRVLSHEESGAVKPELLNRYSSCSPQPVFWHCCYSLSRNLFLSAQGLSSAKRSQAKAELSFLRQWLLEHNKDALAAFVSFLFLKGELIVLES